MMIGKGSLKMLLSTCMILICTAQAQQTAPYISTDGDDIKVFTKGNEYSFGDIVQRLEALENIVSRDAVLQGQATSSKISLGKIKYQDVLRVTVSISDCSTTDARPFSFMVIGNPDDKTVDVFVTTPNSNFLDGSGNQVLAKPSSSTVDLFLSVAAFDTGGSCGNGNYVIRLSSNMGSLSTSSADPQTAVPIVVSSVSTTENTQYLVTSLGNEVNTTNNMQSTQLMQQGKLLSDVQNLASNLNETQTGLVNDLQIVVTNVNYISANISAQNNCSTSGQLHDGNGQCLPSVPTCNGIGSISNGKMVQSLTMREQYSSILGSSVSAKCNDGYYSSGADHSTCTKDGWTLPSGAFKCDTCDSNLKCKTCSDADTCTSCVNGFVLDEVTGTCTPDCNSAPVGKFNLLLHQPVSTTTQCYAPRLQSKYLTDGVTPTQQTGDRLYWHSCGGDTTPTATANIHGGQQCVRQVKVWTRCDCPCGGPRLNGVQAQVLRASDNTWVDCTYNGADFINGLNSDIQQFCRADTGYTLTCPATVASRVRIFKKNGQGTINIAEMQAYGVI